MTDYLIDVTESATGIVMEIFTLRGERVMSAGWPFDSIGREDGLYYARDAIKNLRAKVRNSNVPELK